MNQPQGMSIEDLLGPTAALEAGEIGSHAAIEAIGTIIRITGNLTPDTKQRDIGLGICYGIIQASIDILCHKDPNYFAKVVQATRETYLEGSLKVAMEKVHRKD